MQAMTDKLRNRIIHERLDLHHARRVAEIRRIRLDAEGAYVAATSAQRIISGNRYRYAPLMKAVGDK